jgi:pyridinium-3,5-biscarboxylic acid mononucleotide sulfurtransferase
MNDSGTYREEYTRLQDNLKNYGSMAVAFSGGTDSTFLLLTAHKVLGDKVTAFTVKTPYIPDWEIEEARSFCNGHNIRHKIIDLAFPEIIRGNPEDRCYRCKKVLFEILLRETAALGIEKLVDGTNADDLSDYRPGFKALQELSVGSPLLESGLTKGMIRELSKAEGLPTWDKPAYACLLTRLPYKRIVSENDLEKIEKAEVFLIKAGYRSVRVRTEDNAARIEMGNDLIVPFITSGFYADTAAYFKSIGFRTVSLDLEGYRTGSFNATIDNTTA